MGVAYAIVDRDGRRRFGRETVDDYFDFAAACERASRDDDRTPRTDSRRRTAHAVLDEHHRVHLSEKVDGLGDAFGHPSDRYPGRVHPATDDPLYGRDLALFADAVHEACREHARRGTHGRDWDAEYALRWWPHVAYAAARDWGVVKT